MPLQPVRSPRSSMAGSPRGRMSVSSNEGNNNFSNAVRVAANAAHRGHESSASPPPNRERSNRSVNNQGRNTSFTANAGSTRPMTSAFGRPGAGGLTRVQAHDHQRHLIGSGSEGDQTPMLNSLRNKVRHKNSRVNLQQSQFHSNCKIFSVPLQSLAPSSAVVRGAWAASRQG